jgi:hypothetical protein
MALVLAADDGWVADGDHDGCVLESRPGSHPEGSAKRATCTWPDVSPDKLTALLADYDRYDEFVFPIVASHVVRREPGRTLVYQRHHYFGIADREVLLWMRAVPRDGGMSYEWETADDEPLTVEPGNVRTLRNEGRWFVGSDGNGGARVVHQVSIDPGGSVPGWIASLAGSRGFVRILSDLRHLSTAS